MTNEERKKALAYADQRLLEKDFTWMGADGAYRRGFSNGIDEIGIILEKERARATRLIEALKWYASQDLEGNDGEEPCNLADRAKKALAEYEASK